MDTTKNSINQFLEGRKSDERYASFDYCYNYFYSFYKEKKLDELADDKNLHMSCLQLGFYLASWGMMRGSSFLLGKSIKYYKKLIVAISKMKPELWDIDVDNYDAKNIELLLNCKNIIKNSLENKSTDKLITKIMLGVFANIPAYDTYFTKSFKINSFNEKSIQKIKGFYVENKEIFDSYKIYTIDFLTSKDTNILYTKAKLIDMYGFINGQKEYRKQV